MLQDKPRTKERTAPARAQAATTRTINMQPAPSYRWLYVMLGAPALFPIICMLPGILTGNVKSLGNSTADVLGSGTEALLFACLLISPLVLVTGNRWLLPLRKWYGIMAGITAVADGIIAFATTTEFGSPVERVTSHIFLLVGFVMVLILIPLLATSNNWSQRALGKYWKRVQKLTYVIWALLGIHLALLFNLGPYSGETIIHQRVYQYFFISAVLLFYRLPMVRKGIVKARRAGVGWLIGIMSIPPLGIFLFWYSFIINEEVFKGVAALMGHPIDN